MNYALQLCITVAMFLAVFCVFLTPVYAAGGAEFTLTILPGDGGTVDPSPPPKRRSSGSVNQGSNSFLVFNKVDPELIPSDGTESRSFLAFNEAEPVLTPSLPSDRLISVKSPSSPVYLFEFSSDESVGVISSSELIIDRDVHTDTLPYIASGVSFFFAGGFLYSLQSIPAVTMLLITQTSFFSAFMRMLYIFSFKRRPFDRQYTIGRLLRILLMLVSIALFVMVLMFADKNLIPSSGTISTSVQIQSPDYLGESSATYTLFDQAGAAVLEKHQAVSFDALRSGQYLDVALPVPESLSYGPYSLQITFSDGVTEYISERYTFLLIPRLFHAVFSTLSLYPETSRVAIPVQGRDILGGI